MATEKYLLFTILTALFLTAPWFSFRSAFPYTSQAFYWVRFYYTGTGVSGGKNSTTCSLSYIISWALITMPCWLSVYEFSVQTIVFGGDCFLLSGGFWAVAFRKSSQRSSELASYTKERGYKSSIWIFFFFFFFPSSSSPSLVKAGTW
jgi:hypothetical protein